MSNFKYVKVNGKMTRYEDIIITNINIKVSFIDRLRILIYGNIKLQNKIYTKEIVKYY